MSMRTVRLDVLDTVGVGHGARVRCLSELNRLAWQMTAGTVLRHPQKPALQKSNQSLACVDSWPLARLM